MGISPSLSWVFATAWPVVFWAALLWVAYLVAGWKGLAVLGVACLLFIAWFVLFFVPAFLLSPSRAEPGG